MPKFGLSACASEAGVSAREQPALGGSPRRPFGRWALGCAALLLMSAAASAQEPASGGVAKPISAGLLLGAGVALGEDYNPWGFGIGARAGYNYGPIFVGGRFVFHLGTTASATSAGFNTIEIDYNLWELGVEAGYDLPLIERAIIRPGLLLGIANLIQSSEAILFGGTAASGSEVKLLIAPGASALYDLTPDVYLGLDVRPQIVIGGGAIVGLALYANGGLRF